MLAERAVLVTLSIGQPQQKKVDREQTRQVAQVTGAKAGAAEVVKNLIDRNKYEPIRKLVNELREFHYSRTAPWVDRGPRILSTRGYMDYCKGIRQRVDKIERAKRDFINEYDSIRTETALALGSMFDVTEFPSAEAIKERIYAKVDFYPVPAAGDFRIEGIDDAEKAILDTKLMAAENAALIGAMDDVRSRMVTVTRKMANALTSGKRFSSTLVTNIEDLCDLLPSLNFTDDPVIDEMAREIKAKLTLYDADSLKAHPTTRESVTTHASRLASKMESLWNL